MTRILFVCLENSCRSQIAEGYAKRMGDIYIQSYSAGSNPRGEVDEDAIKVMLEDGVDISSQRSKGFGELPVKEFDIAISMGCGDTCPIFSAKRHLNWEIENPRGKSIEIFRGVRDDIKSKVGKLLDEIREERYSQQKGKIWKDTFTKN